MRTHLRLTLLSLSISLALAACGGGGGGSNTAASGGQTGNQNTGATQGGNNNGSQPGNSGGTPNGNGNTTTTGGAFPTATASMVMACVDTPDANTTEQCSGSDIAIPADKGNGVLATNSGVQVYGRSTSDLKTPIAHPETATGFELASGGLAEMRLFKGASGSPVSKPALILTNLGIKWDNKTERPPIIETFLSTQGRTALVGTNRTLSIVPSLPAFDFDPLRGTGTQANYANNSYFPRPDKSRCPTNTACPAETAAGNVASTAGNWQTGGTDPDITTGYRYHEDGDVHAPNVPFPGSKGFRTIFNMSYRYANLTKWESQDTTEIAEWAGTANEHNLNRRGIIAFGDVTNPATMPTAGTATYKGWVRGWYTAKVDTDPTPFLAEVTVEVDFAKRQVTNLRFDGAKTDDAAGTALQAMQLSVQSDSNKPGIALGAANTNVASYLTAGLANGNLKGGIGGRFFGPATNGAAPPEVGASFSLSDSTTGASAIGGFIAIKRTP